MADRADFHPKTQAFGARQQSALVGIAPLRFVLPVTSASVSLSCRGRDSHLPPRDETLLSFQGYVVKPTPGLAVSLADSPISWNAA